jgi:stage II sporulation protein D
MRSDQPQARRSHRPRWALPLLVIAALLLIAPAAEAAAKFRLLGHGFGHGVGLSQWGSYGYAEHGASYRKIVTHYFQHTDIEEFRSSKHVRVLLATASGNVSFSGAKRACGVDLRPKSTYEASRNGSKVRLERPTGKRLAGCGSKLIAKGVSGPIVIGGQGSFRGDLVVAAADSQLYVVNQVGLDDYVQGVIPNEMPSSWPHAALEAQAVAALATDAGGELFDQYSDTRSQVYGGLGTETAATNRAVRRTKLEVLEYRDEVIPAFFSSSSGGRTENVEFGFPGAEPKPYLESVRDPYDDASSDHRWKETMTRREMQSKLGGLVKGRLQGIDVTKRGVSPRIVYAKIVGSNGSTEVTGSDLRLRLGLRSTWVKFKKIK